MSTITDSETRENRSNEEENRSAAFSLSAPVRLVGFWMAIALPFLYLPLLAAGLETTGQRQTFLLLLVLNVVALTVGRRY
ncbi:hypothetical protein [Haladaptatus halobius]|jgi:hypothetical protein|uniref:hypothetical protein n=1 Tax=Haladaptatus halobius TaxID=2884875 RepID=UPI001D0A2C50|nr:hypothetical protein [Haladaptatus halobius]